MKPIEEQLILHEGLKLYPYTCPAGKLTIGVGRNLEANGVSETEARFLLKNDIKICIDDLNKYIWFKELDPIRQKVLIDMRFNLGSEGLKQFKRMIKALENHDYGKAAAEMKDSRWYGQVNVRSRRLVKMMITGEDYYD